MIDQAPFTEPELDRNWLSRGTWPASWIAVPGQTPPLVAAFRCSFDVDADTELRVHVSADEQYELFLDGARIGSGSERSDPSAWAFDTFDLSLARGEHTLVARTWTLGPAAPRWQMGHGPAFLLAAEDGDHATALNSGTAQWQARRLTGYRFTPPFTHDQYSIPHQVDVDAAELTWHPVDGGPGEWVSAEVGPIASDALLRTRIPDTHLRLRPAKMPTMTRRPWRGGRVRFVAHGAAPDAQVDPSVHRAAEATDWQRLLDDQVPVTVAAGSYRCILVDLDTYLTGRPELRVSGGQGAHIQVSWAESLFDDLTSGAKGDRGQIEHKSFIGVSDTFHPDGSEGHEFEVPMVWRAGRYVQLVVHTAEQPVVIEALRLIESRYPLTIEAEFACDNPDLSALMARAVTTIEASCHDVMVDGPYYEQMMWAGDGVQNALDLMVLTSDDLLVQRWLTLLDGSRDSRGLTAARWPARDRLTIAPYSLYWVQVVHHYAMWRDDEQRVRSLMPGVRAVLHAFERYLGADGLLHPMPGWNFVDWVDGWEAGVPPGADDEPHAIINWHLVCAMNDAAELEEFVGEPDLARRLRTSASALASTLLDTMWSADHGLFADTQNGETFSEHAQCFALLSGQLEPSRQQQVGRSLLRAPGLTRTTFGFTHYYFECCRLLGAESAFADRLQQWFDLAAVGLKTLPERPEPTRSDCHAWSAHPLFHSFATLLGIRPTSFRFRSVEVRPLLETSGHVVASLPHPRGRIRTDLQVSENQLRGWIELAPQTSGELVVGCHTQALRPGRQQVQLPVSDGLGLAGLEALATDDEAEEG